MLGGGENPGTPVIKYLVGGVEDIFGGYEKNPRTSEGGTKKTTEPYNDIPISYVSNKKWFDKECRLKRHTVRKLANQKHRDPLNCEIRKEYMMFLEFIKNTLKFKKEHFHQNKLQDLERASESDPNSFWKTLKNTSDSYDNPSFNSYCCI